MICVCMSRLLHAIPHIQPTLYQLFLAHLDHVGLLIRHVLELQMNLIFTNVFIEIGSNILPLFDDDALCAQVLPLQKICYLFLPLQKWVITDREIFCSPPATNILVHIYIVDLYQIFIWYLQDKR